MSDNIDGLDKLLAKLNTMPTQIMNEGLEKGVKAACNLVKAEAKLLCPVDKGELRQSIKSSVEKNNTEIIGTVYTNKSYAPYVEFGTGPVGQENHAGISPEITPAYSQQGWSHKDSSGRMIYTNGQAAQPFMYPALKNNEDRVTRNVRNYVKRTIEKGISE